MSEVILRSFGGHHDLKGCHNEGNIHIDHWLILYSVDRHFLFKLDVKSCRRSIGPLPFYSF